MILEPHPEKRRHLKRLRNLLLQRRDTIGERLGSGRVEGMDGAAPQWSDVLVPVAVKLRRLSVDREAARERLRRCRQRLAGTLGEPTRGYIARDHPVQRRVTAAIAALSGHDLEQAPWATDGCNIPTIGLPLAALARAAANIADPAGLADERRTAITRVRRSVAGHPFMVAGDGRACTRNIGTAGTRVLVKFGAEGVFFAALYEQGFGLALKVRDGATRAADAAIVVMLDRLGVLDEGDREALADMLEKPLRNWAGCLVGAVRPQRKGEPDS